MSSTPDPYTRQFDFETFSTTNPNDQQPGVELEAEFDHIKTSLDETQARLGEIQRDDGALKNLSVHPDALSAATRALLVAGASSAGTWATATAYEAGDLVKAPDLGTYICAVDHSSGTFADDLEDVKWLLVASPFSLSNVVTQTFSGDGSTTVFTLDTEFSDITELFIFVGGAYKRGFGTGPEVSLSLPNQITFSTAPLSGTRNISVVSRSADVSAAATAAGLAQTAAETAQAAAETAQAAAELAQTNAETAETGAEAAQLAAETAQGLAEDARDAAALSASAAATAAASGIFATITNKTANFSPVADTDNGTLFTIDSSAGNVTATLPSIATAGEGERYGFKRSSALNTVTLARNGSDTINGVAGNYTLPASTSIIVTIYADDTSPDNWIVVSGTIDSADESTLTKTGTTFSVKNNGITLAKLASEVTAFLGQDNLARYTNLFNAVTQRRIAASQGGTGLPNGHVDAFLTDTIGSASTNETYDGSAKVYYNPTGTQQIAGGTLNNPGSYTNGANAFDGTDTQSAANSAVKTSGSGYVNGLGRFWSGAPKTLVGFTLIGPSDDHFFGAGATQAYKVRGSNNGSAWTDLYSGNLISGSSSATITVNSGITVGSFEYLEVNVNGNGSNGVRFAEVKFHEATASANMTLTRANLTAQAAPTKGWFAALVQRVDTMTYGTNLTVELTSDGGSHWDIVTIQNLGSYDGTFDIIVGTVTLTGGGTSMNYRLKTLNSKQAKVAGFAMGWE